MDSNSTARPAFANPSHISRAGTADFRATRGHSGAPPPCALSPPRPNITPEESVTEVHGQRITSIPRSSTLVETIEIENVGQPGRVPKSRTELAIVLLQARYTFGENEIVTLVDDGKAGAIKANEIRTEWVNKQLKLTRK